MALALAVLPLTVTAAPYSDFAASLTDSELDQAVSALLAERDSRHQQHAVVNGMSTFQFAHKKTYATADPIKAALFLQDYFGGQADKSPFQHHCADTSLEEPQTKNVYFPRTREQPNGFAIHFVRNPHKAPDTGRVFQNASALGLAVQRWRGNFSTFDQYMDNHLGLVFDSLDPLVAKWRKDGVPFICRTWFCGPGMPRYEQGTCPGNRTNTQFGETGCYIEAPHGIIVEALCPLGNYAASRACLTAVEPDIFDLCSAGR